MAGQRLGILGGTFDPVHYGHLAVADQAFDKLALDELWFVPAAQPPHKPDWIVSPFADRVAMLEIAGGDRPGFTVSRIEGDRPAPSYTIDTLKELRRRLGRGVNLFFLVGQDAFAEISTWKDYLAIPFAADLVVITRSPLEETPVAGVVARHFSEYSQQDAGRWTFAEGGRQGTILALDMKPVAISSSEIRQRIKKGRSIDHLVPDKVAEYVRERHLYLP